MKIAAIVSDLDLKASHKLPLSKDVTGSLLVFKTLLLDLRQISIFL